MVKKHVFKLCMFGALALTMPVNTYAWETTERTTSPVFSTKEAEPETPTGASKVAVKGKVINEQGEPLIGVNVRIKGSNTGTITDVNGQFELSLPHDGKLVFSYIGYLEQEQSAQAQESWDVVLKEDTQTLGEVIVTTQKRRQTSIEVPTAVSALSGSVMERLRLKQMDEMAVFTPGLQVQIQSPNNPGYVIRGVTSDGGESYSQPRISVFMDGVSISRAQASVVELFDMERVEVVKGPQGTLFGRGAEIGAMHLLRNKPTPKLSGEINVNYGSHNQRGAEGFLNTPINDRLANRFAFSYDAHDGFIDNLAGGKLNGKSALALRNSTRLMSGENTVMNLVLDYQYDDYPGTSFKNNQVAPEGGDTSPFTPAYLNGGKDLGILRHNGGAAFTIDQTLSPSLQLTSISGFRAYKSNEKFDADGTHLYLLDCQENVRGNQFSQELRLNWDNGGGLAGFVGASYFYEHSQQNVQLYSNLQQTLPMVAGPNIRNTLQKLNLPATVTTGVVEGVGTQLDQLATAFPALAPILSGVKGLLTATIQKNLGTALTGVAQQWEAQMKESTWQTTPNFYGDIHQTVNQVMTQILNTPAIKPLLGQIGMTPEDMVGQIANTVGQQLTQAGLPAYSQVAIPDQYQENATNYATNQAVDLFADLTWRITRQLSFTAGLRGTYEHLRTGYSSTSDTAPLLGSSLLYQTSDGKRVWESGDYYSWVGRAALNYMFGHNNLYASVSRGRRPAVIAFNNRPDEVTRLKPEIIVSYEVGLKGRILDNRLNYDLSLFYYDWSHFQSTRLATDTNGTKKYVADDAGKAHSLGVEAGLRYTFCPAVSVFGNYAYIEGKFNDEDGNGHAQEYAGNRFRLTPEHSAAIGVDVTVPVSRKATVYFRPTYSYKSKVYFENENSELLSQKGYGLLNALAGIQVKAAQCYYEVGLFGKNMLNEKYLVDAGNSGNQIGFPTFVAGSPSVFGASFKIGF